MFKLPEEERLKWKEQVRLYEASHHQGSLASWCKKQQISCDSFRYWRNKFGSKISKPHSSFTELLSPASKTGVTIECHSVQIHLTHDFDQTTLLKCLKILRGNLC